MFAAEAKKQAAEARKVAEDAKELAVAVKSAHEAHEKVCAERQGHIMSDLTEIKGWLKWVLRGLVAGAVALLYNALHAKGIL